MCALYIQNHINTQSKAKPETRPLPTAGIPRVLALPQVTTPTLLVDKKRINIIINLKSTSNALARFTSTSYQVLCVAACVDAASRPRWRLSYIQDDLDLFSYSSLRNCEVCLPTVAQTICQARALR